MSQILVCPPTDKDGNPLSSQMGALDASSGASEIFCSYSTGTTCHYDSSKGNLLTQAEPSVPESCPDSLQSDSVTSTNKISRASIAGITVGAVVFLLLLAGAIWAFLRVRRSRRKLVETQDTVVPFSAVNSQSPLRRTASTKLAAGISSSEETLERTPGSTRADDKDQSLMRQNDALRARLQNLESELQGYLGEETPNHSPPDYESQL
ncbi:hypothetical protein FB45DRAFT_869245 [Roridomyces roridus]|uniref:Uncharacterized protein n=1 Tax=Roridomyces roridus TaxID=1738132 RepID=A0AAD7BNK1_9AGAR|nr:hypothetical protein FB45DRAFT_869245 [Roridomyces roridus]